MPLRLRRPPDPEATPLRLRRLPVPKVTLRLPNRRALPRLGVTLRRQAHRNRGLNVVPKGNSAAPDQAVAATKGSTAKTRTDQNSTTASV
jgi:hypothetical protein